MSLSSARREFESGLSAYIAKREGTPALHKAFDAYKQIEEKKEEKLSVNDTINYAQCIRLISETTYEKEIEALENKREQEWDRRHHFKNSAIMMAKKAIEISESALPESQQEWIFCQLHLAKIYQKIVNYRYRELMGNRYRNLPPEAIWLFKEIERAIDNEAKKPGSSPFVLKCKQALYDSYNNCDDKYVQFALSRHQTETIDFLLSQRAPHYEEIVKKCLDLLEEDKIGDEKIKEKYIQLAFEHALQHPCGEHLRYAAYCKYTQYLSKALQNLSFARSDDWESHFAEFAALTEKMQRITKAWSKRPQRAQKEEKEEKKFAGAAPHPFLFGHPPQSGAVDSASKAGNNKGGCCIQ